MTTPQANCIRERQRKARHMKYRDNATRIVDGFVKFGRMAELQMLWGLRDVAFYARRARGRGSRKATRLSARR